MKPLLTFFIRCVSGQMLPESSCSGPGRCSLIDRISFFSLMAAAANHTSRQHFLLSCIFIRGSQPTLALSSQCGALFPPNSLQLSGAAHQIIRLKDSRPLPALRITPEEPLLVHTQQLPVRCSFCPGLGSLHRVTVIMLIIYTHSLITVCAVLHPQPDREYTSVPRSSRITSVSLTQSPG